MAPYRAADGGSDSAQRRPLVRMVSLVAQAMATRTISGMLRDRVELQCHDANGATVPLRLALPAILSGERAPEDFTLSLRSKSDGDVADDL